MMLYLSGLASAVLGVCALAAVVFLIWWLGARR